MFCLLTKTLCCRQTHTVLVARTNKKLKSDIFEENFRKVKRKIIFGFNFVRIINIKETKSIILKDIKICFEKFLLMKTKNKLSIILILILIKYIYIFL